MSVGIRTGVRVSGCVGDSVFFFHSYSVAFLRINYTRHNAIHMDHCTP